MNYLPTSTSRLEVQHLYQVSFKSMQRCRRSWEDKLDATEWWNDGMTEWRNDGMTEWRTKQTLNAPLPFYGGGIKIQRYLSNFITQVQQYPNKSLYWKNIALIWINPWSPCNEGVLLLTGYHGNIRCRNFIQTASPEFKLNKKPILRKKLEMKFFQIPSLHWQSSMLTVSLS